MIDFFIQDVKELRSRKSNKWLRGKGINQAQSNRVVVISQWENQRVSDGRMRVRQKIIIKDCMMMCKSSREKSYTSGIIITFYFARNSFVVCLPIFNV